MDDAELRKMLACLSDRDLRKWCLETAIEQANKIGNQVFSLKPGFDTIQELRAAHIDLANAYYAFISTGKTDARIDTSDLLLSATKLLAARNIKMHATVFNKKLIASGLLEQCEDSSGLRYMSLTKEGLKYGENRAFFKNNGATQPFYFDGKFDSLLKKTGIIK